MSATDDRLQVQTVQLAHHILLQGQSVREAAKQLDLSEAVAYRLVASDTYKSIKQRVLEKYGEVQDTFFSEMESRIRYAATVAIDRLEQILESSVDEQIVARVAQDMLNRAGFQPTAKVEQKILISMDEKTIGLLRAADHEHDAIETQFSDWGYASERPKGRVRELEAPRRLEGEVATESPSQHVLLREGSNRVSGSDAGSARHDDAVDSEADEEETGASPA